MSACSGDALFDGVKEKGVMGIAKAELLRIGSWIDEHDDAGLCRRKCTRRRISFVTEFFDGLHDPSAGFFRDLSATAIEDVGHGHLRYARDSSHILQCHHALIVGGR